MNFTDVSINVVVNRANLVSWTFLDISSISDTAYLNCSLLVIETILEYPAFAASDISISAVFIALSSILERGVTIPVLIQQGIVASINALNEHRQLIMSPTEKPISFYTRNLRYVTSVEYLGAFVDTTVWHVARSPLEVAIGGNTSYSVVVSEHATNSTVANTVVAVGISSWEIMLFTGDNIGNSSKVYLQTNVLFGDIDSSPSDSILITLYNHQPVKYRIDDIISDHVYCFMSTSLRPYKIEVDCGDSVEEVICPGNVSVTIDYKCSYHVDTPECLVGNDIKNSKKIECTVLHYDSHKTVCECSALGDRRSLQYTFHNPEGYDFMSSLLEITVPFQFKIARIINIPGINGNYVLIFAFTLIFTVLAVFSGA